MGRRPTPHVDTSAQESTPATFQPAFITADAPTKHIKVGLHGDNGTGKTLCAGTFPKPIVFSFDPGYASLRQLNNAADIQIVPIADTVELRDGQPVLVRGALQHLWDYYRWLKAGDHDRETAVLDSITEIGKVVLEAVMRKQRSRQAPGVPDTDDYIEANAKITTLIRHFRDLPMHVVFLGHSKVLKKKDDIIGVRFDLSDKLATALGGACDVVMHTMVTSRVNPDTGETTARWVGATVPVNGVQAKDRSGMMRKPTAPLHFNVIAEAYGLPFTDTRVMTSTDMHDDAGDTPAAQNGSSAPASSDGAPTPTVDAATAERAAEGPQTPTSAACGACDGSGADPDGTPGDTCPACGGTGEA